MIYDVVFLGFLGQPATGESPARAIARAFGVPEERGADIARTVPCVVRYGVTEAVARKYHNAFTYIGARCEFRPSNPRVTPAEIGHRMPAARTYARPSESDLSLVRANGETQPGNPPRVTPSAQPQETLDEHAHTQIHDAATTVFRGSPNLRDTTSSAAVVVPSEQAAPPVVAAAVTRFSQTEMPPAQGAGAENVVARVRAAWERGEDAPLPATAASSSWDAWIDDTDDDTEFPSNVNVQLPTAETAADEAPCTPEVTDDAAQIDALVKAQDLGRMALVEPDLEESGISLRGQLFGSPLGSPTGPAMPVSVGADNEPPARRETPSTKRQRPSSDS